MPARVAMALERINRSAGQLARPKILAMVFMLCALPTGLGCALLTPVGMAADETEHVTRADGLLHGEIFGRRPPPGFADYTVNAGVNIDNGLVAVLFSKEFNDAVAGAAISPADRRVAAAFPWFAGTAYYPSQMVEYFPVMYLPAAAGLQLGKCARLGPYDAFYLGRVAMLLAFSAMGGMAIGLARFGNGLIFALLSLPSTISLAASYNQDGQIIACCALAAALLSRCGPGLNLCWLAALALLTAAGTAKLPYAVFLLLCLPPLAARGLARRAAVIGLAGVLPGLWLLHCTHFGFIAYQRAAYQPGPLWPGRHDMTLRNVVPADNLRVLLAHPGQVLWLPLSSFARDWPAQWPRLLGGIYDWLRIAAWEYPCLAAMLLAAACAASSPRPRTWRGLDAGLAALVLCGGFIAMELSMYLSWSNVGYTAVAGINPRYFMPLLPFLIFLLPCVGGAWRRLAGLGAVRRLPALGAVRRLPALGALRRLAGLGSLRLSAGWLCLPAVAMALVNVYALPVRMLQIFHMPGP